MKTKIFTLFSLALFCMASCSKDSGTGTVELEEIVGKWSLNDGFTYTEGPPISVFNEDRSYERFTNPGADYVGGVIGSYKIEAAANKHKLTLDYTYDGEEIVEIYNIVKLDAQEMILQTMSGKNDKVVKFKRSNANL